MHLAGDSRWLSFTMLWQLRGSYDMCIRPFSGQWTQNHFSFVSNIVICLYFMYSILYTVSPSPKNKTIQYERLPSMEEHIISCAIPLLLSSPVRVRIAAWFGWTARGCCTPCHCRAPPTCRAAPRPAQNCSSLKRSHPDVERENRHLDNHLLAGSWPLMRECWGQKTALLTSDQYHWSFIIWFSDPVGLNQDLFSSLAVARVGVPGLSINVWLL